MGRSRQAATAAPALSVIVPAFEEADRIGPTLLRLVKYLEHHHSKAGYEILVVDDGSRDATARIAEQRAGEILPPGDGGASGEIRVLRLESNRGKGAALRHGVSASRGDRVLLTDADLSTPIEELDALSAALDAGFDVAIGSRALPSSRVEQRQPLYRQTMGKIFNRLVRLLVVRGFHDTQCGFKLLRGEIARDLFGRTAIDRFAYDVELVWLAQRLGYRVIEIGVRWVNSPDSRVHPIRDSLAMLRDLVRMRWHHRRELQRTARAAAP